MRENEPETLKIAVVIPSYRVTQHIEDVIARIGSEVTSIIVVDDACPDNSGDFVEKNVSDNRVSVIRHSVNQGVGGAVVSGYRAAIKLGAEIVVKVDGDGQMDPSLIPNLIRPIVRQDSDYVKGNRFDSLEGLLEMPRVRILGNAVLSLWSKLSTGYWSINDPTNGFTAIHGNTLRGIPLDKLRKSYFFESDILFRLSVINAVVSDMPMAAVYGDEKSHLRIRRVLWEFPYRHTVNYLKRIFYRFYLKEWSIASIELPIGLTLLSFGAWFGLTSAISANIAGRAATAGQVTLSAIGIILGVQLLLSFLAYDIQSEPRIPRQRRY